ncbi:unnamed protein product [Callosobruchus maculatus]|uniref:Cyclin-dependent kinase 20 n=1 Tax=Callosobruchus maculatus TaxID=64391 RepID=A0A653BMW5_CALMS|nr:unnamed protein product [Callosobruchus maculatus]
MNNYKLLGRAGEGAHGFVFKGLDTRTQKYVALKKVAINPNVGIPKNTFREICSLRVLKSKNIVQLFEVTTMGSSVILVMEYLPWSLADVLKKYDKPLTLSQIKAYSKMILNGVDYMHQNHIMHRDMKPANLMISEKGVLKIADFGLARIYDETKPRLYSHQVATRWYRAPELLYGSRNYTPSVDMWSVGCIIAEMVNGQPLFPGETDIEQLAIVLDTLGTPNDETWPELKELPDYNKIAFSPSTPKNWRIILSTADSTTVSLISSILIYDGRKRLTAQEALKHEFLRKEPYPCKLSKMPKLKDEISEMTWTFADFDECLDKLKKK